MILLVGLSVWEFYSIIEASGGKPQKFYGTFLSIIWVSMLYCISINILEYKHIAIFILLFAGIFILQLYKKSEKPLKDVSYTILGILYLAVPVSIIAFLVHSNTNGTIVYDYQILIAYFILMWTYDTAAYLFGVSMGRHRLFERHSPKKSWEGAIGGAIVALGSSYLLNIWFPRLSVLEWAVVAAIVIVFGTFGDLVESMFKRSLNIKDTSNILPGHGGILDRFDAVYLSVPVVYAYLLVAGII